MNNIMDKYIDNTEKNIHKYMKMIFNSYYDKDIVSEYINTYINIRYYNIYNGKNMSRPFYLKIMDELNQKAKILKNKYGKGRAIIGDEFYKTKKGRIRITAKKSQQKEDEELLKLSVIIPVKNNKNRRKF